MNKIIKYTLIILFSIAAQFSNASDLKDEMNRWKDTKNSDLQKCNSDSKGDVCIDLAKKRDLGSEMPDNSNYHAVAMLKISCDKGNANGCELAKTFKINQEKSLECYYEFETGDKCYQLGLDHKQRFLKKSNSDDLRLAGFYFKNACLRNNQKGCDENSKLNTLANSVETVYSNSSSAVTLSVENGKTFGILIRGKISKGDYEEFVSIVKRYKGELATVYLDSVGGDAIEAMKIGRLINKLNFETWAPGGSPEKPICYGQNKEDKGKTCTCLSSCVLIHMAGKKRFGDVLGIHRIYPKHDYLKDTSADEAKKLHDAIKTEAKKYITEMGGTNELVELILSIPSTKIKFLSKSEIEKFVPNISSEYQEWLIAKCGDRTELFEQQTKWHNENKGKYKKTATVDELKSHFPDYKKIEDNIAKSVDCENTAFKKIQKEAYLKNFK